MQEEQVKDIQKYEDHVMKEVPLTALGDGCPGFVSKLLTFISMTKLNLRKSSTLLYFVWTTLR